MTPRFTRLFTLAVILSFSATIPAQTPMDTAFTYQGLLKQSGSPVTNSCDFQFGLYDALSSGHQIGTTLTKTAVSLSNGLFAPEN